MNANRILSVSAIAVCLILACAGCIKGDVNIGDVNVGSNSPTFDISISICISAVVAYFLRKRQRDT